MTAPKPDPPRDRHKLTSIGRLTGPDARTLDAWLRTHANRTGQSAASVVTKAVQHYRAYIDPPKEPE